MNDVVILGRGIVGNMAAAWLRRRLPDLRVTVIGRTNARLPIVGESLVEYSTLFLRTIGMGRNLVEEQLPKFGLTFYYKVDPAAPGDARYVRDTVPTNPALPSFLINRHTFGEALERLNRQNGVEYVEGRATEVDLDAGRHRIHAEDADGAALTRTARWVIDATGRRRLLARQLGLELPPSRQRNAFWFRLADFDPAILERLDAIRQGGGGDVTDIYYTTHHFFGRGNWIWLIPLRGAGGRRLISVGLTSQPDVLPGPVTSVPEFLDHVGREHPVIADFVRSGEVVDTNLYRNYMYRARQRYSPQGWFLIGDAADTVDPLYSSGLALNSAAIEQVGAAIRADREGGLTEAYARDLDRTYVGLHGLAADRIGALYDVTDDSFQCRMRMHLHVGTIFHLAAPFLFSQYHTHPVGAALLARLGRADGATARQLAAFEPLIAAAAARSPERAARTRIHVQSSFAVNNEWFEQRRDEAVPRALWRMFGYLTSVRLRLLGMAGPRWWFDRAQLGGLLHTMVLAVALRAFRNRSLKESPLIRRLFTGRRGDAPRPAAADAATDSAAAPRPLPSKPRLAA